MTSRSLSRQLLGLAWPMLVGQVAVVAYGLADTIMSGHLSALDQAAVGIGASINITVFVAVMGPILALTPVVSHLYGAGKLDRIGQEVRQCAWLALGLGITGFLVLHFPDPILRFAQTSPEVTDKVRTYLATSAWGLPAGLAFRVFYAFSTGIGKPRPIMVLNIAGLILKLPLNLVFIYGVGPLAGMGAVGCAVASAIATWATTLGAWYWWSREPAYEEFRVFHGDLRPHLKDIGELLRLGLPMAAVFLVDVTAFTFMALFIARLGPVASAAHQIVSSLAILAFMLPMSLGHSTSVLVGHALGAQDRNRAAAVARRGYTLGSTLSLIAAAVFILGNHLLAAAYSSDAAVRALAADLLVVLAFYHWGDALQAVAVAILRGHKRTTAPMVVYTVALWGIGLGGGYVLGLTDWLGPPRGAIGFWMGGTVGMFAAAAGVFFYWRRIEAGAAPAR